MKNSYKMRMQLGLFDPNVSNAYTKIPKDVVGSASFADMSRESARKSMVLLKNAGAVIRPPTLPKTRKRKATAK